MSAVEPELSATELIDFVWQHEGRRLSPTMLQYFTEKLYLKPRKLAQGLRGSGRKGRPPALLYSSADVTLVRWMVRLKEEGVALKKFKGALSALRELLPGALREPSSLRFFVMSNDRQVGVSVDGRQIQLTGDVGQVLLTFPMNIAEDTAVRLQRAAAG